MSETIARLASGKTAFLHDHHLLAAARVTQWFERACLRERVTMAYSPVQPGGTGKGAGTRAGLGDMAIDARKSLNRLYTIMPRDCAGLLIDICGFEKSLQVVEQERGWPRRSAKLVLRIALEQLATDLGLTPVAEGKADSALSAWMETGARPTEFGPAE